MLDKRLCTMYKVDKVEEFLVNQLDDLDDKIEVETDKAKLRALKAQKRIIKQLKQDYEASQLRSKLN